MAQRPGFLAALDSAIAASVRRGASSPRRTSPTPEPEPKPKARGNDRNTGIKAFLFGSGVSDKEAQENQDRRDAVLKPRKQPNTKERNASLGSGARGSNAQAFSQVETEKAKAQDEVERKAGAAAREGKLYDNIGAAWTGIAKRRELSADEWSQLTEPQRAQVSFNAPLLGAIDADKVDGGTSRTDELRAQLGFTEDDVSSLHFAKGVTAVRESDLFGEKSLRTGVSPDEDQKKSWASELMGQLSGQAGAKREPTWTPGADPSRRQAMVTEISKGVNAYFNRTGGTFGVAEPAGLDSILGKTSVTTGSPETDQYMAEIFDAAARRSTWDSGATYDQLTQQLAEINIDPALFAQYAGEKAADAESKGIPLITDAADALDPAAFRAQLGLTEG